jgi:hypothetical protein
MKAWWRDLTQRERRTMSAPAETEVPWFGRKAKCGKCGGKRVDVRPNWNEQPRMPTKLRFD